MDHFYLASRKALVYNDIGVVYFYEKTGNYNKVIKYAKRALAVAKKIGNTKDIIKILELLSKSSVKNQLYKEAYQYYVERTKINDSIFTEKNKAALQELMVKYKTEQKELEIKAYREKEKYYRQKNKMMFAGIVLLVFVFAMILRFFLFKRKHEKQMMKKNNLLNDLEKSIEEIDKGFFKRLCSSSPELQKNDLRHAALIKLNLNIKQTASLLNLSPNSIKSTRNRLKKKLNLSAEDNLGNFIQNI